MTTIGCVGYCTRGGSRPGNLNTDHSNPYGIGWGAENKGGDGSHYNMPPFYVLTYIMKIAI